MTAKSILTFEPVPSGRFEGQVRAFNPSTKSWLIAPSYTAGETTTITHIVKKRKCCGEIVIKECGTKETRYAKKAESVQTETPDFPEEV
jgi:hypothetical protein